MRHFIPVCEAQWTLSIHPSIQIIGDSIVNQDNSFNDAEARPRTAYTYSVSLTHNRRAGINVVELETIYGKGL